MFAMIPMEYSFTDGLTNIKLEAKTMLPSSVAIAPVTAKVVLPVKGKDVYLARENIYKVE